MLELHAKADKEYNLVKFNNALTLPGDAPLGAYKASIKVRDKNSGGTASTTVTLTVEE